MEPLKGIPNKREQMILISFCYIMTLNFSALAKHRRYLYASNIFAKMTTH